MATCASRTIQIKTGSDATFTMTYKNAKEEPISLSGYDIAMDFVDAKTGQVHANTSIGDGIIVLEQAGDPTTTGKYNVDGGNTIGWSLGEMPVDIKYTKEGKAQHTEDLILDIIEGRTK